MESHPNEMWFLYNPKLSTHKKTKALALSITNHINEFSLTHNKLSKLRWAKILSLLQQRPKDLFNKAHKKYQEEIAGHDFDDDSWLEILHYNSEMIKGPIAIFNNKAVLCTKPKDIYKLTEQPEVELQKEYNH